MISTTTARPDLHRAPPVGVAADDGTEATLRRELDLLNTELRELKSTDLAVRAYVEFWLAFVAGSIGAKLLFDWHRVIGAKFPVAAPAVLFLTAALAVDAAFARVRKSRLSAKEDVKLARQRQLRTELGLDDAPVPAMDAPVAPQLA